MRLPASPKWALLTVGWRTADVGWFTPVGLPSHVGQFWSHATLNKCVRQDGWGRSVFSWGKEKMLSCRDTRVMKWLRQPFFPSCCKKKKGWKELCCQEKVLIRRYGWCCSSESRCYVSVTSVHSHHIHCISSVQFNSTLFTNHLLRSGMSLGSPGAHIFFRDPACWRRTLKIFAKAWEWDERACVQI